uniref:Chitin-binding type-4 domain-containing protein n=1 Tax=Magallana gigas TaxID=29159 RepID=A0A8W8LWQ2_MAGGI
MFPTAFVTIFMTVLLLASSQPALGTHRSLLDRIRDERPRWISASTGSTYIIWGKHSCPAVHGTKEVYNGYVGGSQYDEKGNGANTLCLPHDPDRLPYGISLPDRDDYAHLFGGEYQLNIHHVRVSENVPCAVCRTNIASSTIMIPAKRTCPTHWQKQYTGILTANRYAYRMIHVSTTKPILVKPVLVIKSEMSLRPYQTCGSMSLNQCLISFTERLVRTRANLTVLRTV